VISAIQISQHLPYIDFEEESKFNDIEFRYANFKKAYLIDSIFTGGSFHKANFSKTKMEGIKFKDTSLAGACLEEASLGSSLTKTDYQRDYGQYSKKHSRLQRVVFESTDLKGVDMRDAKINSADFKTAKGINTQQIKASKNWEKAEYSDALSKELGITKK
jgi:uncharacterized protein YjbI with pentapeptide repeats